MNISSGHSFLIAGLESDIPQVLTLLGEQGIETAANPDLYIRTFRQFGIDDAHELRSRASSRAIGERRVFVIAASGMTSEAQNALLKTLEEPPAGALFIFVIPSPLSLLATVRSRSTIVTLPVASRAGTPQSTDVRVFLSSAASKRLDILKGILEKDDDDKYDTAGILAFLTDLEMEASHMRDVSLRAQVLESIYRARSYMSDRGALVKTLLESVALLAPVASSVDTK